MTILLCLLVAKSILFIPAYTVSPEGVAGITAESTAEDLTAIFGPENIETVREDLGEGYYCDATLINPGTADELSIIWTDGAISEIRINCSGPRTAEGIGLGSTLTDLEEVIGEFEMAGFAWDAEGYVDLDGTIYQGLYIRLTPEVPVPSEYMGDMLFPSAEMRQFDPVVTDLRVFFR